MDATLSVKKNKCCADISNSYLDDSFFFFRKSHKSYEKLSSGVIPKANGWEFLDP
jgi:hypothetical protein